MANLGNRTGSFVVLFKDNSREEVFLVFRTDYPVWVLSGGGQEPSESPEESALREAYEETGFKTKIIRQVGEYVYPHKSLYLFEGRYLSGDYKPEYEGNIGKWFSVKKLPLDITSVTRQIVSDVLNHQGKPFVKPISNELPLSQNILLILRHPKAFLKLLKSSVIRK